MLDSQGRKMGAYIHVDEHNRRVKAISDRIAELEAMVKVFRGCIETGVFPKQGSRCHKIIYELVGESEV